MKPLQPPGYTLTRRPPTAGSTPSCCMNFMTSPPATGVTVMRTSGWLVVLTVPPACIAPGYGAVVHPFLYTPKGREVQARNLFRRLYLAHEINTAAAGRFPTGPTVTAQSPVTGTMSR